MLHVVLCLRYGGVVVPWCKERRGCLEERGEEGCLRADNGMGRGCVGKLVDWWSATSRYTSRLHQHWSRVRLVVLYNIIFATGADLTISVR